MPLPADIRARAAVTARRRDQRALVVLLLALPLVAGACRSPVGVDRTGFEPNFLAQRASVLDQQGLSLASLQLLSFVGLDEEYRDDPETALRRLEEVVLDERRRRPFAALAELSHERARATGDRGRYLLSALYAWIYLFSDEIEPAPDPFDPLFRLSCDLYNRSLALALLEESGSVNLADQVVETPLGPFRLEERRPGFPWGRDEFARFLPADAFTVRGLRDRVRRSGLGVPLIGIRTPASVADPRRRHLAPNLRLPATALMRPDGSLAALRSGRLSGAIEIWFPPDSEEVEIAGRSVALEADLTAPLAFTLEDSPVWDFSLLGFRKGEEGTVETGVYLTQPYQRGKVPVLLVHGTASNPAQWAQLVSGLQLDPRLRSRYQLWVGLYHTGNPILYSAWGVRSSLREVVHDLDPGGSDPAIAHMVVVGHSQGGLIARLLVTSSGNEFWSLVSSEPFEEYPLSDEAREILGGALFFDPLPFITRVVFISTPHRGSYLAASWIGRLAHGLVDLPRGLSRSLSQLRKAERLPPELRDEVPTSVENMDPDSRFVRILDELPFAPRVHLHSIVAVKGDGPAEKGKDGVVAYESAHLEQAESELVVRHGHSCQNEPETVLELRRILLEHLEELDEAGAHGGVPAKAPADPERP